MTSLFDKIESTERTNLDERRDTVRALVYAALERVLVTRSETTPSTSGVCRSNPLVCDVSV